MKRLLVFGVVTVAAVGPASAQYVPDEEEDEEEIEPEQPPDIEPEPEPDPESDPVPVADVAPVARRPKGFSIAIGAGWVLPSDDLKAPSATSVRVRLRSGLTFEPIVTLSRASTTDDNGTDAVTTTTTELSALVLVRYPYRINGRVDFSLCGGLGISRLSTDGEGMMPDTSATGLDLSWGIALDYWIRPHWAVSLTGLNPFAELTKDITKVGGIEMTRSSNLLGIIFDPEIFLMFHLYL